MMGVKQGGIKYHFFSFCYDSSKDSLQIFTIPVNVLVEYSPSDLRDINFGILITIPP